MNIELTKAEHIKVQLALLNLSQDIRFVARFRLKDHESLKNHLTATHKNIELIDKIINNGKIMGIVEGVGKFMDEVKNEE